MGEEALVGQFKQRPLKVSAIRWDPVLGAGHGVRARPKKHESNPDEWFVVDRFKKEVILEAGSWVLTYPDGSNAIVADGTFQALYEQDVAEPGGQAPPTGHQEAPVASGGAIPPPNVEGGDGTPGGSTAGSQGTHSVLNPGAEGLVD